nr:hypothetical protein BaRGS_007974 [Batillaria attramentaria]
MSLDVDFRPAFSDHNSPEFRQFSSELEAAMTDILQDTGRVSKVMVTDIRSGSTVVFYTVQYNTNSSDDAQKQASVRQAANAALAATDQAGSVRVGGYNVLLAGPILASTDVISKYNQSDAVRSVTCQLCTDVCFRRESTFYCGLEEDAGDKTLILALVLGITLPVLILAAVVSAICWYRYRRNKDVVNISYTERDPFHARADQGANGSPYIRNWRRQTHDFRSTVSANSIYSK